MAELQFTRCHFHKPKPSRWLWGSSLFMLLTMMIMLLARPALAQAGSKSIWSIVPSPNPNPHILSNDQLYGVAALSDTDVWTVGLSNNIHDNNINKTLIEHWNGTDWKMIASPNVGKLGSSLYAVSAVSSNDVWAVGNSGPSLQGVTLIEHWNGTQWSVVPSPNLGSDNVLKGVVAISASNVWAAGWYATSSSLNPLILHFDGATWSAQINVPAMGDAILAGISAHSATDIWAVGDSGGVVTSNFALHWDGSVWKISPTVSPQSPGSATLSGVAAINGNDVWAVGNYVPPNNAENQTEAIHWNGTKWSLARTANVDKFFNLLFGVAAVSSSDVWAVGYAYTTDGLGIHSLIERWNGKQWTVVPSPNRSFHGASNNELRAALVSGATTVWAVGAYSSFVKGNPGLRTLTLHTTQG